METSASVFCVHFDIKSLQDATAAAVQEHHKESRFAFSLSHYLELKDNRREKDSFRSNKNDGED